MSVPATTTPHPFHIPGTSRGAAGDVTQADLDALVNALGVEAQDDLDGLFRGEGFEDAGNPRGCAARAEARAFAPFGLDIEAAHDEPRPPVIDRPGEANLDVKIELGRRRMLVQDVLKLTAGSVVELDRLAGDSVDVFVNDCLVARGEVLVFDDTFCVRVDEIVLTPRREAL